MRKFDIKKIHEWPVILQIILFLILAVFIFWLLYTIDLKPYRADIVHEIQQEEDLKRQLQSLVEKQNEVHSGLSYLDSLKEKLKTWQANILTTAMVPQMINTILKMAEKQNLKVVTFKPSKPIKDSGYEKFLVDVSISGTYDQIAGYISDIANMEKLVVIDNLNLSDLQVQEIQSSGDFKAINSDQVYTADLQVEIYSRDAS